MNVQKILLIWGGFDEVWIKKLEWYSLSLFSYFSLEMHWFSVVLQSDECTDGVREQIKELSNHSDKVTKQVIQFIMQQDDGAATASWAELQRELVMIFEEIEMRLLGKQGASSPLFHLNRPCC